jgi:S-DNA-T family DNA segregation ATPase FtsK/SpoIIIE
MTDTATEAAVGTLHRLDDRRTPPVPDQLTKQPEPSTPVPAVPARTRQAVPGVLARHARRVHELATHDRTRAAGRLTVRHSAYVAGGVRILAKRTWDGRTVARHERMMRSAEAAGQHDVAMEWEQRAALFRQQRHARRMDLLKAPQQLAKAAAVATGTTSGLLVGLGAVLAVAEHDPWQILTPTLVTIDLVKWAVVIVSIVWGPAVFLAPWIAFLGLWNTGRRGQAAPQWALPAAAQDGRDVVPDEGAILNALRHLGIGPLNKAFKDGWQPRWVSPTGRLGNGWQTQLQLPLGVTVEMIVNKKRVLAHNLLRLPVEVWPTQPRDQPGVMDLWVADQGSLSGPVPPWPLLTDGTSDYFKGVPVAVSQRGEPVFGKLMAANYMVGGVMGVGKSSMVVSLLLGAMLDPLVEIDVYVMAYNVDYDPMRPRLRTLVKGDEEAQLRAARDALRALRDDVTLRGKLLDELGGENTKLTRELAMRDPRMRPRVVVFDECHELFMDKQYGPEAAELAIKVMKKARKVGITLIWATVSPTADSIPRDVTRNTSHGVAFAVGDHVANDGLLGTGKHKAGITATTLSPTEDIGTAVTVGFTRNPFELIRTYYVRKDAEVDQVSPVVARAMALREGIEPADAVEPDKPVDHLADIAAAIGDQVRVRTTEMLQLLDRHNPTVYRGWTHQQLKAVLEAAGAEGSPYNGYPVVSRARVLAALAERDEQDVEDTAEDQ